MKPKDKNVEPKSVPIDMLTKEYTREDYDKFHTDVIRKMCTAKAVAVPNGTSKGERIQKLLEADATRSAILSVNGTHSFVAKPKPIIKTKNCSFGDIL